VPNVRCPSCGLSSYVAPPHSGRPVCPHCDTDLFPALVRPTGPDDPAGRDGEAA
jgi:hypothetical protein